MLVCVFYYLTRFKTHSLFDSTVSCIPSASKVLISNLSSILLSPVYTEKVLYFPSTTLSQTTTGEWTHKGLVTCARCRTIGYSRSRKLMVDCSKSECCSRLPGSRRSTCNSPPGPSRPSSCAEPPIPYRSPLDNSS